MSKNYGASGPSASGTALKTALNARCTANLRQGVNKVLIGPFLGPNATDFNFIAELMRSTAQGTSAASAPTPEAVDGGDIPSLTVLEWTNSAEPTYTSGSNVPSLAGNQRATPNFYAQDGQEVWSLAGAATGIGVRLTSTTPSTTWQINGGLFWKE
jgi:hypothetical protein